MGTISVVFVVVEDFDAAQQALNTLVEQIERQLSRVPFIFRKAGQNSFVRELVVPFRGGGCVVLFESKAQSRSTSLQFDTSSKTTTTEDRRGDQNGRVSAPWVTSNAFVTPEGG